MMFFFCESYVTVENALYLIRKCNQDITIVIIGNEDVYKLFCDIKNLKQYRFKIIFIPILKFKGNKIRRLFSEKKHLINNYKKHFCSITNKDILFSTQYYAPYTYYFIKKLHKKNSLIFFSPQNYTEYKPINGRFRIQTLLYNLYALLVFGPSIKLKKFEIREAIPYLSDSFINKNCVKIIDNDTRATLVDKEVLYNEFNAWDYNFRLLYFDTPFNRINVNIPPEEIEHIFSFLSEIFTKEQIGIKLHPSEKISENYLKVLEKYGTIIPNHIMGQFLLHNVNTQYCIGFSSTVLFDNKVPVNISLLKMVGFLSEKTKIELVNYTISRSKNNIFFPENFEIFKNVFKHKK
ncbi:MAG: hypothetical protein JXB34_13600 [Bacteroidales bacterium]|nr:hypothetical protein [Bacteroidales bacterium]